MNENSKLYVFAKKEVALIFVFMVLIAVSAFVLGVKIGKNYSYLQAGFTPEDRQRVELLSSEEENLNKEIMKRETIDPQKLKDDTHKALEKRLKEQLDATPKPMDEVEKESTTPTQTSQVNGDEFSGKFTIQLGSHRSKKEAEEFANGFKYRGYNPIINEVDIDGRGTWYRTSLGVFSSKEETKAYIAKEMELFRGQDYVIGRFE